MTHAPFTERSYSYPKEALDKAVALSPIFNSLVHKISQDHEWLQETLKSTSESDEFTGKLMDIYKTCLAAGIKQKTCLGINRSDYMLHQVDNDPRTLLQVEINTIASSFGSLSTRISEMHRRFKEETDGCESGTIPANNALDEVARGIASAHASYLSSPTYAAEGGSSYSDHIILMVVQPGERNVADQRLLQYATEQASGTECVRATLHEISVHGILGGGEEGELLYRGRPVSVVYYRAGYSPDDYEVSGGPGEWAARLMVERSMAIKCPNIAYHLAGTKKVQQALTLPGVLERFLLPSAATAGTDEIQLLRSVFAGLYSLDALDSNQQLQAVKERALADPDAFVLKPQREGGGNNLYGEDIVEALRSMSPLELSGHILMERIRPPRQTATLIRDCVPHEIECLCELGIFGVFLNNPEGCSSHNINNYAGYLLRVKPAVANEGGVAAGYAVLSSPRIL